MKLQFLLSILVLLSSISLSASEINNYGSVTDFTEPNDSQQIIGIDGILSQPYILRLKLDNGKTVMIHFNNVQQGRSLTRTLRNINLDIIYTKASNNLYSDAITVKSEDAYFIDDHGEEYPLKNATKYWALRKHINELKDYFSAASLHEITQGQADYTKSKDSIGHK